MREVRVIECEVYSRVVGYYRPVSGWNDGKKAEFEDRKMLIISTDRPPPLGDGLRFEEKEDPMSESDYSRDLSVCQVDSPLHRLVAALRGEGEHDDVRIGCVVVRVYPWAHPHEVVSALLTPVGEPLPSGWRRGMFAGRAAELAVRARRGR